MFVIDTKVVCHRLAIDSIMELVALRKCNIDKDKQVTI